jgi:hypothetical protein
LAVVGRTVAVAVRVAVAVLVAVAVRVAVAVAVRVGVAVAVFVGVAVSVTVGVTVAVEVFVGVSVTTPCGAETGAAVNRAPPVTMIRARSAIATSATMIEPTVSRARTRPPCSPSSVVGDTGLEPVTSSV